MGLGGRMTRAVPINRVPGTLTNPADITVCVVAGSSGTGLEQRARPGKPRLLRLVGRRRSVPRPKGCSAVLTSSHDPDGGDAAPVAAVRTGFPDRDRPGTRLRRGLGHGRQARAAVGLDDGAGEIWGWPRRGRRRQHQRLRVLGRWIPGSAARGTQSWSWSAPRRFLKAGRSAASPPERSALRWTRQTQIQADQGALSLSTHIG